MITADHVAQAIVAAAREIVDAHEVGATAIAVASRAAGNGPDYIPVSRVRSYAALALCRAFPAIEPHQISLLCGVMPAGARSFVHNKRGVKWLDQAALDRVVTAIGAPGLAQDAEQSETVDAEQSTDLPAEPAAASAQPQTAAPPPHATREAASAARAKGGTPAEHGAPGRKPPISQEPYRALRAGLEEFDGSTALTRRMVERRQARDLLAEAAANTARMQRGTDGKKSTDEWAEGN